MKRWFERRDDAKKESTKKQHERIKSLSHTDTINGPTTHNALAAFWVVCSFVLFLFAANMHVLFTMDQTTITFWAGPWCEYRVTILERDCFKKQSAFYSARHAKRTSVLLLYLCEHTKQFYCNRQPRLKQATHKICAEKKATTTTSKLKVSFQLRWPDICTTSPNNGIAMFKWEKRRKRITGTFHGH